VTGGFEPGAGPAERRALFDLRRKIAEINQSLVALNSQIATINTTIATINTTIATINTTITPTAWTAVASFLNGWGNTPGAGRDASYRKEGDIVRLRGRIRNGTMVAAAFTLPVDFRPPYTQWFPVQSDGVVGSVEITAAGDVRVVLGNNGGIHLDPVSFSVTS
jgi:hypothetical protein